METWLIWIILSLAMFILEVFTPGFFMASLAIGALSGAGFAYMGFSMTIQLACFAVASLIVFFAVRPAYSAYLNRYDDQMPTGVKAMIGQKVRVLEAIPSHLQGESGRIKWGGETWRAFSLSDEAFPVDALVCIAKVDGATVWVEALEKE